MSKKLLSAMVSVAMISSLFAGCGQKQAPAPTPTKSATATTPAETPKEIVKLKWYMSINPVAADTQKVIDELNKYTREKIGVEIDYTAIANPDYKEKMPTYINSGEYFDICFTAAWTTNYLQFASKDAFLDIKDLLQKNAAETYNFIPKALWDAVTVNGGIYGVPSYKEMGWQGGIFVNSDMAKEYGADLTKVKTLADYTEVLKTVKEKSKAAGKDVIGISGLSAGGFGLTNPYESLAGNPNLPGASAVKEFGNFAGTEEVFNQYATKEYMDYTKLIYGWNQAGYTSKDLINYDKDSANRDNDFKNGNLFSYVISYAPGAAEAEAAKTGHGVTFVPLMKPLFETRNAMGGLLAISSASKHPEKAMEFINLLNTDKYVGTLIRHGIEGVHHSAVGDKQIDRTMGGTLKSDQNGYDYVFGWQFGTPFNQKWDISYPTNIDQLFKDYNASAVAAAHSGFTFTPGTAETAIAAITNVVAEYDPALESGSVDPETTIPKFLQALKDNGVDTLLTEVKTQLAK